MFDDLERIVDQKFWKVINDFRIQSTRRYRAPFLEELSTKLRQHEYFPSLPLTVQEADKGHGVARQIPIFNLEDYSVFYYCVRKLEHVLAKNRVQGTYGGWSMGGKIRKLENAEEPVGEYQLTYSYNPTAWAKYYGDYNGKVYSKIMELQSSGSQNYIVFEFDIANFYDNIQLAILENKIRRDTDYFESGILDLLMYFLGYSNRLVTQYQKRSVGIPQDAFGDCSRLLANYYLQDYDSYMHELTRQYGSSYFRYADDQLLFVPDDESGRTLIQMASRRLARLGLNINQKKVNKRTLNELYIYRSFEINDIFKEKNSSKNKDSVNEFARRTFTAIDNDISTLKNRGYPLIKRLVTAEFSLLDPSHRARLMSYIFDIDFINSCRAYSLNAAYIKMRGAERSDYVALLNNLSSKSKHSAFHYEILAFFKEQGMSTRELEERIAELRKNIFEIS